MKSHMKLPLSVLSSLSIFPAICLFIFRGCFTKANSGKHDFGQIVYYFQKKSYKYFRNWWNLCKIRDILDILHKSQPHKSHGLQNSCSRFVAKSARSSNQITGFFKVQYLKNVLDLEVKCWYEDRYP